MIDRSRSREGGGYIPPRQQVRIQRRIDKLAIVSCMISGRRYTCDHMWGLKKSATFVGIVVGEVGAAGVRGVEMLLMLYLGAP